MNAQLVYCIECGKMAHAESGIFGHLTTVLVDYGEYGEQEEMEFCGFDSGFAFVAPPDDLPEGWQDDLIEEGEEVIEPEDDEYVPSGDFWMTPTQYVGI